MKFIYLRLLFVFSAAFILISSQSQTTKKIHGTALQKVKVSFTDIEAYNQLYPQIKTKGRQIKNHFEKFPEIPFDYNNVVFEAPKGSFSEAFQQTKDPGPEPEIDFQGLDEYSETQALDLVLQQLLVFPLLQLALPDCILHPT